MNWLSAAERISAIDRKSVVFSADRCLYSMDKFSSCEACYQVCPVEAITPGKPPVFEAGACKSCLACIPVCPTGVYSAEDAVPALIKCAARMEAQSLELACEAHPHLELGSTGSEVAVRIRGCLAGLGVGGYLNLFATGKQQVSVRLDACEECPWGALQPRILEQIEEAQAFLNAWNQDSQLETILTWDGLEEQERPVWDAENPPLSRRDLFRFASQRGQVLAARAMHANQHAAAERRPSAERIRINHAVRQFPEIQQDIEELGGYALLTVSDDCTACAACERVCPTNAISFSQYQFKTFTLTYQPDHCIGCGICADVCVPDAITVHPAPSLKEIYGVEGPQNLMEGSLTRCDRCQTVMAKKEGVALCPVCQHRQANPFGGQLPPKLLRLMQIQPKPEKKS